MKLAQFEGYFDFWLRFSRSEGFQPVHTRLSSLFHSMRKVQKEPEAILEFQREICRDIISLQFLKEKLKENDDITFNFANHMRLTVMHILDALAWRLFNYDRAAIQLMADHKPTGHLDDTFLKDLAEAEQIVREENAIVLLNDLTNVLRYGDLTIFKDNQFFPRENKSGKASSDNRRATRQKEALNSVLNFIKLGFRDTKSGREYIFTPRLSITTYHSAVAQAIKRAKEEGYSQSYLSECFAIEVLDRSHEDIRIPESRPFSEEQYVITTNNLDVADIPVTKIAPYGIFPFDDDICLDLIIGNLVIKSSLNLILLQKKYRQFGLLLELPQPSKEEIKAYISASIADRRKQLEKLNFIITDSRGSSLSMDFNSFWPIAFEFWREETLIESQRQLLKFIGDMQLLGNQRFYTGYGNEGHIWYK